MTAARRAPGSLDDELLWPAEAVAFLRELEDNNEREWFRANKARWETAIQEPTLALAQALRDHGRPRTFRPYNDTRFRPGPPIKEQVGLALGYEGAGGFYVELSMDGVFVAAGLHNPASDQVARLRAGFDDARRATSLRRAIAQAAGAGLELNEADLKRGPRGYAPDHPRADLLRRRRIMVSQRHELGPWVHSPEGLARVRAQFEAAAPVVAWLRKHVGPAQADPRR